MRKKKKPSWPNEKASATGRSLGSLLTVLKFHVLLKESLFLRLIVPQVCSASSTQTDCVCVRQRIPEYSPPKTLQTMSVQVREREKKREGKRRGNLTRYWTERRRRRQEDVLTPQLLPWKHQTIQTASATAAWRIFEWNKPPFYFSFPLQEDSLAMSKPPLLFPATQSPVASKRRGENTRCL